MAVAEAAEHGLKRRESEGKDIASMGPVCTIKVGRLDDWLQLALEKYNLLVNPRILEWAGVAVFKKTYQLSENVVIGDDCCRSLSATFCIGVNGLVATSLSHQPSSGNSGSTPAVLRLQSAFTIQ